MPARKHTLAITFFATQFAGLVASVQAQDSWSPEPFVAKASIRSLRDASVPQLGSNSLRNNAPAATNTAITQNAQPSNSLRGDSANGNGAVVLRWKQVKNSTPTAPAVKLTSHEAFHNDNSVQLAQFQAPPALNQPGGAAVPQVDVEPPALPQNNSPFRAPVQGNGGNKSLLFPKQNELQVAPEQNVIPPATQPRAIVPAQPDALQMPDANSAVEEFTEQLPLNQSVKPSPFPKPNERNSLDKSNGSNGNGLNGNSSRSKRNSPSDLEPPSKIFEDANAEEDFPPSTGGVNRLDQSCDDVRSRALAADINKIELDVSPEYGTGPKDIVSPEERRAAFSKRSPQRVWYDFTGQRLAEGRLVDLKNDEIIIEGRDGMLYNLAIRELSDPDSAYVFDAWGLPVTCTLGQQQLAVRNYVPTTVAWKASNLCHKPLYFEDVQLERYGHEFGPIIQPALSTVHFFKDVAFLPYKMGIHPMKECQYSLGYYRPGSCAPWTIDPVPLSLRGALYQGAAITGAAAILP